MHIKNLRVFNILILFLITVEVINNSIATILFPIPNIVLQVSIYGSMLLVMTMFFKGIYFEWRMVVVVVAAALSLIMNSIEAKYNAPFRFGSWILLIATVGPLVYSPSLLRFRNKLLEGFFITFMWIGGISFLFWLSGVASIGRGHFSGLMNHSMSLAPVAALGAFYAFYRFIQERKRKKKLLFLTLFIFSTFDIVLASSRTALIAFSLGFLVFLFFNKFRFRRLIILLLIIFTVSFATKMDDDGMDMSQSNSLTGELISRGMENTREILWNDRIREFKSSPVFGVGFASQDDSLTEWETGNVGGKVEPGSTYLMILSMTGLLAAVAFIFFFLKPFLSKRFWKRISSYERYKLASFVFFSVHFVAEGYIYSSGALLAFVFWLLVGATYPYKRINYKQVLGTE